jgi:hypothetical protein
MTRRLRVQHELDVAEIESSAVLLDREDEPCALFEAPMKFHGSAEVRGESRSAVRCAGSVKEEIKFII